MHRRRSKITVMALAVLLVGGLAPGVASAHGGSSGTQGGQELAVDIRKATAQYHRLGAALADGYIPVTPCVEVPGVGAMGVHYLKPELLDNVIDPAQPEVLVYMPNRAGKYKLVAAEFLSTATQAPVINGIVFDAEANPGMYSFTLHAWVWKRNPAGMFAAFNPAISCPGG